MRSKHRSSFLVGNITTHNCLPRPIQLFFIENVQIDIIYQNNSNHSKETKDRRNSYAWTKDTAKLQLIPITILGHQNSLVNSKLNKPITLGPVQNDQKRRDDSSALVTSSI